jgi:hypothetical protein
MYSTLHNFSLIYSISIKGKPVPLELRNKIITSIVEDGIPVKQLAQECFPQYG